jgi:hypothetical protein
MDGELPIFKAAVAFCGEAAIMHVASRFTTYMEKSLQPGIFNLTAEQYHADPAPIASLSSSIANILLDQSPAHAWLAHPRLNLQYEREESSRFDLGSAAHMMLLERRSDRIVRVNADDWRTKAAKEQRDAAQANGQYAVLERQYGDIVAMCTAAHDYLVDTELSDILTGDAEQAVLWQEDKLWYRCRPDLMSKDRLICLDYKSTASAHPDFIARQIGRMGYDLQNQFYARGIEAVTGIKPKFVFLFQEITKPYACSLVALSNSYEALGQSKVDRAIKTWHKCVTTNTWPGYSNKIMYMDPKAWDLVQEEVTKEESL